MNAFQKDVKMVFFVRGITGKIVLFIQKSGNLVEWLYENPKIA